MPSDRNTAYPFLEQMRTEELEALLQQEFTAADGGEPDVDYIMAIMEVMKQRDANPPAAEVDVDAAWRDFKENYQGQASEVHPKSWTKVMRQSHFEFCIGQDLTHSIFL